jgi:hypothetical protein
MHTVILAHAGGIDELGIVVLPAVMGFGTWILTRRSRNQAGAKPHFPVNQVDSSPTNLLGPQAAPPGWKQSTDRSSPWTRTGVDLDSVR